MTKTVAIILNIFLLIWTLAWIFQSTSPLDVGNEDTAFLWAIVLTVIVSLTVLLFKSNKDSWFRLFLKRKALEEKKKISELQK